ncbi:MAG: type III pantothenate kinase [Spirochaetales bacterium]|nr:type III pantothenate kinase [Spirochaetales bacterium]
MVLTIDAGNTNTAIGLFDGQRLDQHWRLSSRTQRTSDEFALHLCELLRLVDLERSIVERAVVCSVVPVLTRAIMDGIAGAFGVEPLLVSARAKLPVTIGTDTPSELGGDLIANAVGGYARVQSACVIVDFGTALTFTAVDERARIRGAAIAPGLNTAVRGLVARTSALPMVDLAMPESFIGTNTAGALRSGIMNGYAGLLDRMVSGIRSELGREATVLLTGGEAREIVQLTETELTVVPWLTLEGLYHIGVGTAFSPRTS